MIVYTCREVAYRGIPSVYETLMAFYRKPLATVVVLFESRAETCPCVKMEKCRWLSTKA